VAPSATFAEAIRSAVVAIQERFGVIPVRRLSAFARRPIPRIPALERVDGPNPPRSQAKSGGGLDPRMGREVGPVISDESSLSLPGGMIGPGSDRSSRRIRASGFLTLTAVGTGALPTAEEALEFVTSVAR
jgi:hypothetical protein